MKFQRQANGDGVIIKCSKTTCMQVRMCVRIIGQGKANQNEC